MTTTLIAYAQKPATQPAVESASPSDGRERANPKTIAEAIERFEIDTRLTLCHVWETRDGSLAGFVEHPHYRTLLGKWLKKDVSKIKLLPEESATEDRFGIVTTEHALMRETPVDLPGDRDNVSDLLRGEVVWILDRKADGQLLVHSSDGYMGWVAEDAIKMIGKIGAADSLTASFADEPVATQVIANAKELLGTPYVWGGKTKAGIDCSGLVQVSFAKHGILLPRDADQQADVGRLVATRWFKDALLPGDLLFFMSERNGNVSHVAIHIGEGRYIESAGKVGVQIRSMNPKDPDYDASRAASFCWARRVID